jgi:branched-chain amino acid transport system substrate-binding protein
MTDETDARRRSEACGPYTVKARWDDYKLLATVPGDQAFQPLEQSRCPLVRK